MKVTFGNRLKILESRSANDKKIIYAHQHRVHLQVFISYDRKMLNPMRRDWMISMEGDRALIKTMRKEISHEILSYLMQRTRQKFSRLKFEDIETLARMRSVR